MVHPRRRLPPYIRSFWQDLWGVSRSIFVYFLGSLVLWILALIVSLVFIPLTQMCRGLVLVCSIPCTCNRCMWRCRCRVVATSVEASWIRNSDYVMTHREFRAKLRMSRQSEDVDPDTEVGVQATPLLSSTGLENSSTTPQKGHDLGMSAKGVSSSPSPRSLTGNIHSLVLIVEKSLDIENLISLIEMRIVKLVTPGSDCRYFPRVAQCLVSTACGVLVWADDPLFSLSRHIIRPEGKVAGQEDLERLLADRAREGLPTDRPLWQLVIVTGYGSLSDTVLIWRFHGAVYDGTTIAKILTFSLATPRNISFKANSQYYNKAGHILKFMLQGPMKFIFLLINRKRQRNIYSRDSPKYSSNTAVYHGWTERTLSLPLLLKNKMLMNMTCNDILLSLVTGASQQVSAVSEEPSERMLSSSSSVLIPFDLWTDLNNMKTLPQGNLMRMVPCFLRPVPAVIPQLWHVEHHFTKLKKSGNIRMEHYVMGWLRLLPFTQSLCRTLDTQLKGDCSSLVTSFNGPNMADSIDGARIHDIMYFAHPPQGVEHSYNFIMYSGTIKLTTLSASERLSSKYADQLVSSMARQLTQLNTMVFVRYFPDGLNGAVCPYAQSQASRLFGEFMRKLQSIDALSQVTAGADAGGDPVPESPAAAAGAKPHSASPAPVGNDASQISGRPATPEQMPRQLMFDEVDAHLSPLPKLPKSASAYFPSAAGGDAENRVSRTTSASLTHLNQNDSGPEKGPVTRLPKDYLDAIAATVESVCVTWSSDAPSLSSPSSS